MQMQIPVRKNRGKWISPKPPLQPHLMSSITTPKRPPPTSLRQTPELSILALVTNRTIYLHINTLSAAQAGYSHLVPLPLVFPPFSSVYLPSKSGRTPRTKNLQTNGGASITIHTTATVALSAASFPLPFAASIAKIGNKQASPRPNSRYVGLLLSTPLRVLVAPANKAEVRPPTTMPPNSRAKSTEEGLMSEGCSNSQERTQRVFVTSGIVNKLATASATKALRIVDPF